MPSATQSTLEKPIPSTHKAGLLRFQQPRAYSIPARPTRLRSRSPGHEFITPPPLNSPHTSDYSVGIGMEPYSDDEEDLDYRDRGFWEPLKNRMESNGFDRGMDPYDSDDEQYNIGRPYNDSPSPSRSPPSRHAPRGEPGDDGYTSEGW